MDGLFPGDPFGLNHLRVAKINATGVDNTADRRKIICDEEMRQCS
jgi:hypothetical protein